MSDGQAQGGPQGDGAALEALQAAAASVQASLKTAEAVCAALQPMVGALVAAREQRRSEWAAVQHAGEQLRQSVASLQGILPQNANGAGAAEEASPEAGGTRLKGQHAGSGVGWAHDASAAAQADGAQAAAAEAAPGATAGLQAARGAAKRRRPMPAQPASSKRRAPKPVKVQARKSGGMHKAAVRRNWRYEDQQAYDAWAAAHPAEASIDAEWEPADVVATGTGSQGPVFLVSWKGWEDEEALRSWHTGEDLRRYNWRPALLEQRAAGKPDRGLVARM